MIDLLTIKDLTDEEILDLLDLADDVKKSPNKYCSKLNGKSIALLFQKTSTRTRISFESGMYQLGGNALYIDWRTTNLHLGSLKDEIKSISCYVDLIMARVNEHKTLEVMRDASNVPVVNGLSDMCHPCQILSDLMTIREKFGSFENIKVSWVGDGNNVCSSLIIGCVKLNIPILVATPEKYRPHQELIDWVEKEKKSKLVHIYNDPKEAIKEANVVYTDTFVSMGQEEETEKRLKIFLPKFQINKELLNYAIKNPLIMHCLPAHRGIEITDDVLDSNNSIVFQQAENRIHLQKALLLKLLKK
ncbi:MAG: ornithine carbamoyltransferase [Promethearchaeota archaeon]|nr:MAG: ornithine carbamoyltransferase [Candidatus Lokiarchaeota archaeon]